MGCFDNQVIRFSICEPSRPGFHALALVDFGRGKHPCWSESEAVVNAHVLYCEAAKVGRNWLTIVSVDQMGPDLI